MRKKKRGVDEDEAISYILQARCALSAQPRAVHSWSRTTSQSAESNNAAAAKTIRRLPPAGGFIAWEKLFRERYSNHLQEYRSQKELAATDPFQAYSKYWREKLQHVWEQTQQSAGTRRVTTMTGWGTKDPSFSVSKGSKLHDNFAHSTPKSCLPP